MMETITITCSSLSETKSRAGCFVSQLKPGLVVGLTGPLGAGKSAFARFVIQGACGAECDVPSPTFTLVQSYESQEGIAIMHLDLYRLEMPEEVFALGVEDSFIEAANLVEWPSKMGGYWPLNAVMIDIAFSAEAQDVSDSAAEGRIFTIKAPKYMTGAMMSSLAEKSAKSDA